MTYYENCRMINRYEKVQCFSKAEMERRFALTRQIMREQNVEGLQIAVKRREAKGKGES